MNSDVLSFLAPRFELLQMAFFVLIVSGVALTLRMLYVHATPASWERNWNGGGLDDLSNRLDAEHGSVNDLSHAVATRSEQLAETMPGILLILGLLGTFLGLGLALDHASGLLQNSGTSAEGMKSSMGELMKMMGGLGTKFKTSTWGIIGFLTLKVWSSRLGVDEKRLRWCVRKMRGQLDQSRLEQERRASQGSERLVEAIGQMGTRLGEVVRDEMVANRALLQQSHVVLAQLPGLAARQLEQGAELAASSAGTRAELAAFVQANIGNIEAMAQSSAQMARAAAEVGSSAGQLGAAIDGFRGNVAEVLDGVKQDLGATIGEMNDNFGRRLAQMEASLSGATGDISTAVAQLSGQVALTLGSLEQRLGETIGQMNQDFGANIGAMSADLGAATGNISSAVERLSVDVNETMGRMTGAITDSVAIQLKAGAQFSSISEALGEQVTEMTQLVKKLGDDILSGLRAVSTSAQEVKSLNGRYTNVTEGVQDLADEVRTVVQRMGDAGADGMSLRTELRKTNSLLSDINGRYQNAAAEG